MATARKTGAPVTPRPKGHPQYGRIGRVTRIIRGVGIGAVSYEVVYPGGPRAFEAGCDLKSVKKGARR